MQAVQPESGLGKFLAQVKHMSCRAVVLRLAHATQFGAPLMFPGFFNAQSKHLFGAFVALQALQVSAVRAAGQPGCVALTTTPLTQPAACGPEEAITTGLAGSAVNLKEHI